MTVKNGPDSQVYMHSHSILKAMTAFAKERRVKGVPPVKALVNTPAGGPTTSSVRSMLAHSMVVAVNQTEQQGEMVLKSCQKWKPKVPLWSLVGSPPSFLKPMPVFNPGPPPPPPPG